MQKDSGLTAHEEHEEQKEMETARKAGAAAPAAPMTAAEEMTASFEHWRYALASLQSMAQDLCRRYPQDRDARYLLADILRSTGKEDLALEEYQALLEQCPPNERPRVLQGIEQCRADRGYFPPAIAERLNTAEYATGQNAEVWRSYARREIQRGREIVRTLRQTTALRGKRVLDVGAGYGGMLLCMAEQGAQVTGVEIDPERARTGKQRLAELGMEVEYLQADICSPEVAARLGEFDVVVCQDVLEHVLDPGTVIRSLCSLLRPGGLIYVQIPNKYGVDQLMSDHHFGLTGLTALSRPQAIEYWQLATGESADRYDVGYERGEKYYAAAFGRCGVKLQPLDRFPSIDHLLWYAPRVSEMCRRLESPVYPGLRPELEKRIRRRMTRVAQLYAHASQRIIEWQEQPALMAEACDAVVRQLCVGLWRFLGTKAAPAESR